MSWYWYALRAVQTMEDRIVALILRQPGFHRAVGRVHRTIHERKHGRNPHEPLYPGEATAEQPTSQGPAGRNNKSEGSSFLGHFWEELRNQFRGRPTDWPGDGPKK